MYTYHALVCPSVNFALYYTIPSLVKSNKKGNIFMRYRISVSTMYTHALLLYFLT